MLVKSAHITELDVFRIINKNGDHQELKTFGFKYSHISRVFIATSPTKN